MKYFMPKNNGAFFNNHRIRVSKKNKINDCLFAGGKFKFPKLNIENLVVQHWTWPMWHLEG